MVTKLTNWQHKKPQPGERGPARALVQHTTIEAQAERERNCLHLYITTVGIQYVGINQKLLGFLSAKFGGFARNEKPLGGKGCWGLVAYQELCRLHGKNKGCLCAGLFIEDPY